MDSSLTTKGGDEKGRSRTGPTVNEKDTSDDRLLELGYALEFRREMSFFGALGMSFCAIGVISGMSSAFQTGLFSGGPLGGFCLMTPLLYLLTLLAGLFWGWNVST